MNLKYIIYLNGTRIPCKPLNAREVDRRTRKKGLLAYVQMGYSLRVLKNGRV